MPATARTPEWAAAVAAIGQLTTPERRRLLGYLLDNLVNLPDLPDAAAERYAQAMELVGPADASCTD